MKENTLNTCAFFVFDEAGNLTDGGAASLTPLNNAVEVKIRIFKKDAAEKMYNSRPSGGFTIVDDFTGGRLKLLTSEMDGNVPYVAITSLIESLRKHFKLTIVVEGVEVRGVFVKPNPAKS